MPDSVSPRSPVLLNDAGAMALVASYGAVSQGAQLKDIGRIDEHMRRFIGLSPICFVATSGVSGKRGDPPGAFKVIDEHISEKAYKEGLWAPMP